MDFANIAREVLPDLLLAPQPFTIVTVLSIAKV